MVVVVFLPAGGAARFGDQFQYSPGSNNRDDASLPLLDCCCCFFSMPLPLALFSLLLQSSSPSFSPRAVVFGTASPGGAFIPPSPSLPPSFSSSFLSSFPPSPSSGITARNVSSSMQCTSSIPTSTSRCMNPLGDW